MQDPTAAQGDTWGFSGVEARLIAPGSALWWTGGGVLAEDLGACGNRRLLSRPLHVHPSPHFPGRQSLFQTTYVVQVSQGLATMRRGKSPWHSLITEPMLDTH